MSRRQIWIGSLVLIVVVIGTTLFLDVRETASASSLSVGARGWIAARLYLKERGREVSLLDRPLDETEKLDVLVLALPWQRWPRANEQRGVEEHLRRGKTVVFAYSGEVDSVWQNEVADWLGLEWEALRGEPPLSPGAWYDFVTKEWDLSPGEGLAGNEALPEVRVSALTRVPRAPEGARVLCRGPDDTPVAFDFPYRSGRVVVLPADIFANSRLTQGGNADLLESLALSLGEGWSFDEYHHGLSAPLSPEQKRPRVALDLLLVHLGLLYVLAIWGLGRPFGPTWKGRPVTGGSTESFLLALGALHDRLGHHREAAELMLRRSRELHPRITIEPVDGVATAKELVDLGRALAERQARK